MLKHLNFVTSLFYHNDKQLANGPGMAARQSIEISNRSAVCGTVAHVGLGPPLHSWQRPGTVELRACNLNGITKGWESNVTMELATSRTLYCTASDCLPRDAAVLLVLASIEPCCGGLAASSTPLTNADSWLSGDVYPDRRPGSMYHRQAILKNEKIKKFLAVRLSYQFWLDLPVGKQRDCSMWQFSQNLIFGCFPYTRRKSNIFLTRSLFQMSCMESSCLCYFIFWHTNTDSRHCWAFEAAEICGTDSVAIFWHKSFVTNDCCTPRLSICFR